MKSLTGKIMMAVIILSCGFVMQVEQSEKTHQRRQYRDLDRTEIAANLPAPQPRQPQTQRAGW